MQQPLVLFILCILCIDVHKKISIPWRRCRSVAEMGGAVPGVVRAGRPRSQEAFIHTKNREHGLHHAGESGETPYASLEYHSPLEGESARPGRSPQSSRWGQTPPGDLQKITNIDAQDAQDFFRKRLACNPEHPQARTGSPPEPASGAATSRPVYPVHPVHRCS